VAAKEKADAGQAEVQNTYDEAAKRGYFGEVPDQPANKEYTLQTGPDSPTAFDEHVSINEARIKAQKASPAGGER
jgi:hypothetical protein